MDSKRPSAGAASSGKHGEKKDENFLTKAAHSIRDKVHGLTDDVKEKTHNLTHSSESKKNKKDKDQKKTDTKSTKSSTLPTAGKKDSDSSSDDKDDPSQRPPPHTASSVPKRDNGQDAVKAVTLGSKPPTAAAATTTTEEKAAIPPTNSRFPSDKPASRNTPSKSSDDHKDAASAIPPSSSKPSSDNSAIKPSGVPSNKSTDVADTTNKPSSEEDNTNHIHISFDGVSTVDDLLDRIDDAIEKAKIVVENGKGTIGLNTERTSRAPTASLADLEKRPVKKVEDDKNKAEGDQKDNEAEPIRLDYNEIHKVEDLLLKLNQQPGNRKVVLENSPDNSAKITFPKQPNAPPTVLSTSITTNENDDLSGPPKSILKTSQNPSSLDTSTKVSSFQDDQIHVNIEDIQNVADLLDRVDDAVQSAAIVIDTKPQGEKRQAPQPPNQNNNNNELPTSTSLSTQKREAPKAPSSTNDVSEASHTQDENNKTPTFRIPDHEFQGNNDNKEPTLSSSTIEKKESESGKSDWV